MQDVELGNPAVDFGVGGDLAELGLVGELADLEHHVPVGQVPEGLQAGAVEGGLLGEGGAEGDQEDLLAFGPRRAPPRPLGGAAVALAGPDEGVHGFVDPVGVRLEGARDEYEAAAGPADEPVAVLVDAVLVEPGAEAGVVRLPALGGAQSGEQRLGDLLLVAGPGDQVRGEGDGGDPQRWARTIAG